MELTKKEAAEFLGVSTRALERYTQQGKIGVKYSQGKNGKQAFYQQSDLEQYRDSQIIPTHKPATEEVSTAPDLALARVVGGEQLPAFPPIAVDRLVSAFETISSHLQQPKISLTDKLVLTIDEAQMLTGFSKNILKNAIKEKKLNAQIIGRSWRIKRSDLDKYIKNL